MNVIRNKPNILAMYQCYSYDEIEHCMRTEEMHMRTIKSGMTVIGWVYLKRAKNDAYWRALLIGWIGYENIRTFNEDKVKHFSLKLRQISWNVKEKKKTLNQKKKTETYVWPCERTVQINFFLVLD